MFSGGFPGSRIVDSVTDIKNGIKVDSIVEGLKLLKNTYRTLASTILYSEEERRLATGDIIGVCRGIYDHYGVYNNDSSVIHYSSKDSDTSSNNTIIETSLDIFLRGDNTVFKLWFPEEHKEPSSIVIKKFRELDFDICDLIRDASYHIYSPAETIARAKSRLGENGYSLLFNNCEHFAIWCKTGISESHQINRLLRIQKDICYK